MKDCTQQWLDADRQSVWHPFTDQAQWLADGQERLVITHGQGVWLYDSEGRRYLDANSSIWTNIAGHAHPQLTQALIEQAGKIAHSSFLGLTNPRAAELAAALTHHTAPGGLTRCFFSDNGSSAVEVALRLVRQYFVQEGEPQRCRMASFSEAYHGDTLGAASIGGVAAFRPPGEQGYQHLDVQRISQLPTGAAAQDLAAVVVEPLVQGVNEMRPWPPGFLKELQSWARAHGVKLIFDEVMTGFGRTGTLFACEQESVWPDFLCLGKALTGGYSPLAATLTREEIYRSFEGPGRTFYYGHSYTGHQLGCAVALASWKLLHEGGLLASLPPKITALRQLLAAFQERWPHTIRDIRQCGLVSGIELHSQGTRGAAGAAFCQALRQAGILTRPIHDTVVIMPPLIISPEELAQLGEGLESAGRVMWER